MNDILFPSKKRIARVTLTLLDRFLSANPNAVRRSLEWTSLELLEDENAKPTKLVRCIRYALFIPAVIISYILKWVYGE